MRRLRVKIQSRACAANHSGGLLACEDDAVHGPNAQGAGVAGRFDEGVNSTLNGSSVFVEFRVEVTANAHPRMTEPLEGLTL